MEIKKNPYIRGVQGPQNINDSDRLNEYEGSDFTGTVMIEPGVIKTPPVPKKPKTTKEITVPSIEGLYPDPTPEDVAPPEPPKIDEKKSPKKSLWNRLFGKKK